MSYTKSLLRTNVKLSGNLKFTISDDGMFFNSIDATTEISRSDFKNFIVDPGGLYPEAVARFWKHGETPTREIFFPLQRTSDKSVVSNYKDQYERDYQYGATRLLSKFVPDRMAVFAPLFLYDKVPTHFIVFKLEGLKDTTAEPVSEIIAGVTHLVIGSEGTLYYNGTYYQPNQTFVGVDGITSFTGTGNCQVIIEDEQYEQSFNNISNLVKKSKILKVYDLSRNTPYGDYLNRIIENPSFKKDAIEVDYKSMQVRYTGIDLESGVFATKSEDLNRIINEFPEIVDFDEHITNGFERLGMVCDNLLNLEFAFDDSEENKFNRYFGLYLNEKVINEFYVDFDKTFVIPFNNKALENGAISDRIKYNITDELGINIIPEGQSGYSFSNEDLQKNCLAFYKNEKGRFFKLKDDKRIQDTTVAIDDVICFEESRAVACKKLLKGNSSVVITLNENFDIGDELKIIFNNSLSKTVIADPLDNYSADYGPGKSAYYFFYPDGSTKQKAQALTSALNYVLTDTVLKAVVVNDKVVIYCKYKGKYTDHVKIETNSEKFVLTSNRFKGASINDNFRVVVNNSDIVNIAERDYIKTELGYVEILDIHPYVDSAISDISTVELRDAAYLDITTKSVITLTNELVAISIANDACFVYKEAKISEGFFSFVDIEDFDFDSEYSDYANYPKNEYYKYFGVKSGGLQVLRAAENEILIKKRGNLGNTIDITISYGIYVYSIGTFTVTETSSITMAANIAAFINSYAPGQDIVSATSDGSKIKVKLSQVFGQFGNNFTLTILITGLGTVLEYSDTFYDGNDGEVYAVLNRGIQSATIEYDGVQYTSSGGPTTFMAFKNTTYTVIDGEPVIIALKYLEDKELAQFIGFNSLDFVIYKNSVSIENRLPRLLTNSNEYIFGQENKLEKNFYKNKVVPTISKWVLSNGKDVRNNDYRLNTSLAFNEYNFSPSFIDKVPNPQYFSHEWSYLGRFPEGILNEDLLSSEDYFPTNFDINKYKSTIFDYFQEYFTVTKFWNQEVKYQRRYATFGANANISETVFKGIKVRYANGDLNDYKFSVITNFYTTKFGEKRDMVSFKIIKNDDHKSLVIIIEVTIDDYKVNPYNDSKIYGEYAYFYMMNDLKTWDYIGLDYIFGKKFIFPTFTSVGFPDSFFYGVPVTNDYLSGYRPSPDVGLNSNLVNLMTFDESKIRLEYSVKENDSNDFGTLLGFNLADEAVFSTSQNGTVYPDYSIGQRRLLKLVGDRLVVDKDYMYAICIGLEELFAEDNVSAWDNYYNFSNLVWYQEGAGKNAYINFKELISFASIRELVESKHPLVNTYSIKNGELLPDSFTLQFIEKDTVNKNRDKEIFTEFDVIQELNNTTIKRTVTRDVDKHIRLFRYSGSFSPKTIPIFQFKNFEITRGWSLFNTSWNGLHGYTWNQLAGSKVNMEVLVKDRVNSIIEDGNNTAIEYFHKKQMKYSLITNPNIPELGQISIQRAESNVLKDQFEQGYYFDNENNGNLAVSGAENHVETKSFFKTALFNTIADIKVVVDQDKDYVSITETPIQVAVNLDLVAMMVDFYKDAIKADLTKYFRSSSFTDIDAWIYNFIVANVFDLYNLSSITVWRRNSSATSSTINTEQDELILLSQGFLKDARSDVRKTNSSVSITFKKDKNVQLEFNIRTNFQYK